jgi:hypothetical protein
MLGREIWMAGERSVPLRRPPPPHNVVSQALGSDSPPSPAPTTARSGSQCPFKITELDALASIGVSPSCCREHHGTQPDGHRHLHDALHAGYDRIER